MFLTANQQANFEKKTQLKSYKGGSTKAIEAKYRRIAEINHRKGQRQKRRKELNRAYAAPLVRQ